MVRPRSFRKMAVFCGSSPGSDPRFAACARDLGLLLAQRGIGLVYGGGHCGLMGEVADAALQAGGEVIGVIPEKLAAKEIAHLELTELRIVGSMHERKAIMADLADGFIALPGGLGTLEEIFEILTWAQLGMHQKPCGFVNCAGYYDGLLAFLDHTVASELLKPKHRRMILVAESPNALLERFVAYEPVAVEKWIDRASR